MLERVPMKLPGPGSRKAETGTRGSPDPDLDFRFCRKAEGCLLYTDEGFEDAAAAMPSTDRFGGGQAERQRRVRGSAPGLLRVLAQLTLPIESSALSGGTRSIAFEIERNSP